MYLFCLKDSVTTASDSSIDSRNVTVDITQTVHKNYLIQRPEKLNVIADVKPTNLGNALRSNPSPQRQWPWKRLPRRSGTKNAKSYFLDSRRETRPPNYPQATCRRPRRPSRGEELKRIPKFLPPRNLKPIWNSQLSGESDRHLGEGTNNAEEGWHVNKKQAGNVR